MNTLEASEIPTEEIIVTNKSFSTIRLELRRAENNMYSLYNSLIEDEDFKIVYKRIKKHGSQISRRVCEPNFIIRARIRDYQKGRQVTGLIGGMEYVRSKNQLNRDFSGTKVEMEDRLVDLALENPELYDAILEARDLGEELELAQEIRFGN